MTDIEVVESKLFLVTSDLVIYPTFFVSAKDMVDAVKKATTIIGYYGKEKTCRIVSISSVALLDYSGGE